MSSPQWCFGGFRLDPDNACLWRGAQAIALTPKAFEVLRYLVTHPDRLVTKDTLLDAVWPATAVSDAVVRVAIGELRRALVDTVQAPRFIATMPRRGYRFLASVTQTGLPDEPGLASPASPLAPALSLPVSAGCPLPPAATPLVGREAVLTRLHAALAQARQGTRQVRFLTGEPGIGKTAVLETFAAQIATDPGVWLASGQCIEHYGLGEPYLPVLEALGQLCRVSAEARLGALLRQQAPTWLVQMPWLLTREDREHLQQELQGTTRERMLREFAELLETLTAETPLVLLLEDLHWSDHATLDLVTLLARRRTPAQFLLLGTFRPVETIVHGHPLRTVVQDLQRHGSATALPLAPLTAEAVTTYLTARFPGHHFPVSLAPWLHEHTDGNPLFLVTMVSALVERGVLIEHNGHWTVQGPLNVGELGVPEGVRPLLEQQLERLPPEAQQVVEVASVAGVTFTAAAAAAGLEAPAAQVETWCEVLARYHVLQPVGLTQWPDGTVTTRYRFTHALYQQTAYERTGIGRRAYLHQRIGTRLEAAYGDHTQDLAAELAIHWEHGRDHQRVVHYRRQAAENALRRSAHHEAILHFTIALERLTTLPDTLERAQHELDLQLALGVSLIATHGLAAPIVERVYARVRALCQQIGDTPQLFPGLWGSIIFYTVRGELQTAWELAMRLHSLAQQAHDTAFLLEAHHALWSTAFWRGDVVAARTYAQQGRALYVRQQHQALAYLYGGHDPGVCCRDFGALALWFLGYPDQARSQSQEAQTLARELSHPFSLAEAFGYAAWLAVFCREAKAVQAQTAALHTLAQEHDFLYWLTQGSILEGWACVVQGQEGSTDQMSEALAAYRATGSEVARPYYLALLAEAYGYVGKPEEGVCVLTEGLEAIHKMGGHYYEAELYRLQGELLRAQASTRPMLEQAEAPMQHALAIARRQQAKSLELRAAMSLARLWQQQGKRTAAHQLLSEVYSWFTEGFDTADLQEAAALLEALAPGAG